MAEGVKQVAVWVSPERESLVREVAQACEMTISHAGAPDASQTRRVAGDLGAAVEDDLRRLIVDPPGDRESQPGLVLIADLAPETELDARHIAQAAARGGKVATLEPLPHSALTLTGGGWMEGVNAAALSARRFVPAMRLGRAMREAREVLEHFAEPSAGMVESVCGPQEGSLGARLFDAMDVVLSVMGEAETVMASFTSAIEGAAGAVGAPGESLLGLAGTMGVTLRFAGGRTATVFASDRAAAWRRSVTLLGAKGRLTVKDDGFEWRDATGAVVDASKAWESPVRAASVIAEAVARFADPRAPQDAPGDLVGALSMCQAALLAARTGQAESPATIRRMAGLA